ncbi:unnamed protein product [Rotaria magnacalcarata]|uniref:VCBS repeat-containing protein n=2 Tax=Rotaria magnacalcarata TaxID=392030 RepID=A0A816WEL8_9BILA|nr:unnamed protein product [Rotaria magnacalcarata]
MYSTGATSPISLAVGDINKDSRLNVIVVSNDTGALNIPFGSFEGLENQVNYSADSSPYAVTIGDLNNDGTLGIIIANDNSNDILTSSNPYVVAIGDLNNDTRLDIVVANYHSDALSVLLGHGNGSFADENRYDTGFMPASIANGDFNNDTRLDTAVANCSGHDVTCSNSVSVAVVDLNNGTLVDIVVANSGSNDGSVLLGFVNIDFVNRTTITTGNGSKPRSFVIGDFNNDSRMDIVAANSGSNKIAIFIGYGNFTFLNPMTYATGFRPMSISPGDFNNDTQLDIVIANYDSESVSIFLGYGNGSFATQETYSTGSNSYLYFVTVGDYNNDAIQDIVVGNQGTNNLGIFLGYGKGTFLSIILYPTGYGSCPFSIVVGDFNNDRKSRFCRSQ